MKKTLIILNTNGTNLKLFASQKRGVMMKICQQILTFNYQITQLYIKCELTMQAAVYVCLFITLYYTN